MEGYLVTEDITWITTGVNGSYREYVLRGTIYIPKLDLKLYKTLISHKEPLEIRIELRNVKEFGLNDTPKLKKITINDSKAQTLVNLLREKAELPKKLEDAVKEILTPIPP